MTAPEPLNGPLQRWYIALEFPWGPGGSLRPLNDLQFCRTKLSSEFKISTALVLSFCISQRLPSLTLHAQIKLMLFPSTREPLSWSPWPWPHCPPTAGARKHWSWAECHTYPLRMHPHSWLILSPSLFPCVCSLDHNCSMNYYLK